MTYAKHYDIEAETFSFPYPDTTKVCSMVRAAIERREIAIFASSTQDFQRLFDLEVKKMEDSMRAEYYAARKEYDDAIKAKYGGFNEYMHHKHGLSKYNAETVRAIDYHVWDRGSHSCESDIDGYYADAVDFVDEVLKANSRKSS